jgi:acetolactate synthase I/II/III large subunit
MCSPGWPSNDHGVMMIKGSDLLVAALENEGVERIFGVPGEENLDVVESLRKSRIELVVTRHEQAAAFMAATHGRLTGRPGVCITTLGPGALNLTTGAAYAHLGAMPMIMLTGQKGILFSRQARFQIVDIIAAKMLLAAKRPLLMAGAGANRPRLTDALSEFVRRTRLPFFNTQMGKGAIAGGSKLYMGTAALSERDYVHRAIDRADVILSVGHDTVEKPPFLMGPKGPKVIHVGFTPAHVEQVFYPHAELVGDVGPSLALLADRIEGKLNIDPAFAILRTEILAKLQDRAEEARFPPTPQRIVHDVRAVMPEDGVVCLDNGMYKIWFARNYRTHVANTLLLDNALATMGAGLPSAMMAAMLYPERRVLAVAGDGGFMMNSQEMETAVRLKLNLVVLILEDNAYGMIRWKQAVDRFPDFGLGFGNPDFVKYADSYGAKGRRVESADGLAPALEAAFKDGGVQLVVVPIDYSENVRVLVEELAKNLG